MNEWQTASGQHEPAAAQGELPAQATPAPANQPSPGRFGAVPWGSLAVAAILVGWDAVLDGSLLFSILICPLWFSWSVLKNLIQRPGWRQAVVRVLVPLLTLGVVLLNNNLQCKIAEANAPRIVSACDKFHAAHGRYPENLNELVPDYLPSVPRAKYCIRFGEFHYWRAYGRYYLLWYKVPPFGRKIYDSSRGTWGYID